MSKDTEVDMKDVELNEMDQEKQPMTGGAGNGDASSPTGAEKNGSIKLKIPEEIETKFTGLSKEELLRVAGTPGWVRTRWALLILFWLGWLGMLAGAVAIIVQAPRCKELPAMNWWNYGPLYQIDVQAFSESKNLKGVEEKIDSLGQLKVKGLIIGPIHVAPPNQPESLDFVKISSEVGNLDQFKELITTAHKKSINVILDLTPNYLGTGPWYSNSSVTNVAERLKIALVYWLGQGVDGILLSGVENVATAVPTLWAVIRAIVQNVAEEEKRVLVGVTEKTSAAEVSELLNSTGVDLLLSGVFRSKSMTAVDRAETLQHLLSSHNQTKLAWNIGDRKEGHLATLVGPDMVTFNQLLLLTLPGTPVFNYGDEIALEDKDTKSPDMLWDSLDDKDTNGTAEMEKKQRLSCSTFFKTMSDLRGKERSLQHGDYIPLFNSTSTLVYLRRWDQSARYIAAFNWHNETVTLQLSHPELPKQAVVLVSTDKASLAPESDVELSSLRLSPGQAVLLQFPYIA
ncbi:solute carrier family 3 member 2b [Esox lucius]|uniref:Glycosyl hydrolase family 13 catalytic domain-containing protein n=1 Tax=Esox lucius TaxID=8010 RepID=A0A3P8YF42_ESOLU|nr:solute carrier family 3 member 2b [Esox lucius]XP_010898833.1 solute carrier family 3 member 2b [Esox lucius]